MATKAPDRTGRKSSGRTRHVMHRDDVEDDDEGEEEIEADLEFGLYKTVPRTIDDMFVLLGGLLEELGLALPARIDTGAETASVDARDEDPAIYLVGEEVVVETRLSALLPDPFIPPFGPGGAAATE